MQNHLAIITADVKPHDYDFQSSVPKLLKIWKSEGIKQHPSLTNLQFPQDPALKSKLEEDLNSSTSLYGDIEERWNQLQKLSRGLRDKEHNSHGGNIVAIGPRDCKIQWRVISVRDASSPSELVALRYYDATNKYKYTKDIQTFQYRWYDSQPLTYGKFRL